MNIFVILALALLIIMVLLRRHVPIGPAILAAGFFIWATTAPQFHIFYLGNYRAAVSLLAGRALYHADLRAHLRFNFGAVFCNVPGN